MGEPAPEPEDVGGPVMQGDVVRSRARRGGQQLGWVCCLTPESDEGHVYWQSFEDLPAADSREPLHQLRCADRALIPGDIVRYVDAAAGRDAMGMVVGTEVLLDLCELPAAGRAGAVARKGVRASSLQHLVPIRLATWVVHRADGWLGRVQSWDEDLLVRFAAPGGEAEACQCRLRAANQRQGVAIAESFYRDFFPGLRIYMGLAELRSGALECEWLVGDAERVIASATASASPGSEAAAQQRAEAVIEDVSVGAARVEWLAQVPLWRGWSSERPPKSDGCQEDKLQFLLGEAELSSRWALGDRVRFEGEEMEVCSVQTFVEVRWQDGLNTTNVPSCRLQLCNPDAFSFFPSELVCQRTLDESAGGALPPPRGAPQAASGGGGGGAAVPPTVSSPVPAKGGSSGSREEAPRVGFVVRADPASRMVAVRWLDEGGLSEEDEWSAFDLQIDPEFGYRLGDAVIRCRDWEEPGPGSEGSGGPRVGQVVAFEAGSVKVQWLDGVVALHAPQELYRVSDEEEGSAAGSEAGDGAEGNGSGGGGPPVAGGPTTHAPECPQAAANGTLAVPAPATPPPPAEPEEAPAEPAAEEPSAPVPVEVDAGGDGEAPPQAATPPPPPADAEPPAAKSPPAADEAPAELDLEDIVWEPLPTDHHFLHCSSASGSGNGAPVAAARQFARRVQREWTILRRGLPRNIWVHVYPDCMELLRACLVGPEGTPYADALFFFDVHLPPSYPQIPPQVRFWSFGENLNPNLYENGKVCLSLLGTWSGKDSETWSPERSNLLQVLVSILGLVLNTEPYYNEPGFERERNTAAGDLRAQRYNESVALSNYHLMLRVLRSPPGDFQTASRKHFTERRDAILARAEALNSGEVPGYSEGFRKSLAALLPRLEESLPRTSG